MGVRARPNGNRVIAQVISRVSSLEKCHLARSPAHNATVKIQLATRHKIARDLKRHAIITRRVHMQIKPACHLCNFQRGRQRWQCVHLAFFPRLVEFIKRDLAAQGQVVAGPAAIRASTLVRHRNFAIHCFKSLA